MSQSFIFILNSKSNFFLSFSETPFRDRLVTPVSYFSKYEVIFK